MTGENENGPYPRRDPTTASRAVADEGWLVVVPSRAEVNVMNPVGGKIYSLLDGHHSETDIVRAIVEEFDVSEADARRDVREFLDELRDKGMLATAGGKDRAPVETADE